MEYIIKTDAITMKYGKNIVLDKLSMNIPKGSIYGLIGKNGAGKTTIIRILTGLQEPVSGSYSISGIEYTDKKINTVRRKIGAVVETPSIYLDKSAIENLRMQSMTLGLPSFDDISNILEIVGLNDVGNKRVRNFSLGMKQRLGIAMALVGNPDILVLDEPVNGLDPQGIVEVRELMLKLNRERQITVIISSHYLDELSKLATHYGFIEKGRLINEISAAELEMQFRKSAKAVVNDINAFSRTLDKMNIEYEIVSDTEAIIYGNITFSRIAIELAKENCEIISMYQQDESLENYFINLVGGGNNE